MNIYKVLMTRDITESVYITVTAEDEDSAISAARYNVELCDNILPFERDDCSEGIMYASDVYEVMPVEWSAPGFDEFENC